LIECGLDIVADQFCWVAARLSDSPTVTTGESTTLRDLPNHNHGPIRQIQSFHRETIVSPAFAHCIDLDQLSRRCCVLFSAAKKFNR